MGSASQGPAFDAFFQVKDLECNHLCSFSVTVGRGPLVLGRRDGRMPCPACCWRSPDKALGRHSRAREVGVVVTYRIGF